MTYCASMPVPFKAGQQKKQCTAWDFVLLSMSRPPAPSPPEEEEEEEPRIPNFMVEDEASAPPDATIEYEIKAPKPVLPTTKPFLRRMATPCDPNFASICRETFEKMWAPQEQWDTAVSERRRQRDLEKRRKDRAKAAAWRRAVDERDKQEHEEIQARKEEQERAKLRAEELELHRMNMRRHRWVLVQQRLNEEGRDKKEPGERDAQIDGKRKETILAKKMVENEKRREERKHLFEALPVQRRQMFQEVFSHYDADNSGSLQAEELCNCLLDLGFRGYDPEERHALVRICENAVHLNLQAADSPDGSVDLHQLATEVIPGVSRQLNKLRKKGFLQQLSSFDGHEDEAPDVEFILSVVKELWPFEHDADDDDKTQVRLLKELREAAQESVDDQSNISRFLQEVGRLSEEIIYNVFDLQQKLKVELQLTPDQFREFRSEIIHLDRIFKAVDMDCSGHLDQDECTRLFKEIGLIPKNAKDREVIMHLLSDDMRGLDDVDFPRFLDTVADCRKATEKRLLEILKILHPPFATDEDASIPRTDLDLLVKSAGLAPRSRKELRAMNRVVREADIDSDGRYTLDEVLHICRRSQEKIREMRLKEEMAAARGIGFSEVELNEARFAFEQLDDDCSGSLSKQETRNALDLLDVKISNKNFAIAFERLDEDRSGSLELPEFMRLLHFIKDIDTFINDEETHDQEGAPRRRTSLLTRAVSAFDKAFTFSGEAHEDASDGEKKRSKKQTRALQKAKIITRMQAPKQTGSR